MANTDGEVKVSGVYGGVETGVNQNDDYTGDFGVNNTGVSAGSVFKAVPNNKNLPVKTGGFMSKVKAFLFQEIDWHKEIKVELTPYQQKIEDEINEFLHQEITWTKVKNFLFQDVSFGKKKAKN